MTITDTTAAPLTFETRLCAVDLYLGIHKGIRALLFDAVGTAGRIDPVDASARAALAEQVRDLTWVLDSHAHHEDSAVGPALAAHLPHLAERIAGDHAHLDARVDRLRTLADATAGERGDAVRLASHELYLELASFTGAYLTHQDVEERVVMPALDDAIGAPGCAELHVAIISSIPPDEMATSLAFMLPAMNIDDRAGLLGGMQASAPPAAFEGVWALAGTVLTPADHAALAARLGLVA